MVPFLITSMPWCLFHRYFRAFAAQKKVRLKPVRELGVVNITFVLAIFAKNQKYNWHRLSKRYKLKIFRICSVQKSIKLGAFFSWEIKIWVFGAFFCENLWNSREKAPNFIDFCTEHMLKIVSLYLFERRCRLSFCFFVKIATTKVRQTTPNSRTGLSLTFFWAANALKYLWKRHQGIEVIKKGTI